MSTPALTTLSNVACATTVQPAGAAPAPVKLQRPSVTRAALAAAATAVAPQPMVLRPVVVQAGGQQGGAQGGAPGGGFAPPESLTTEVWYRRLQESHEDVARSHSKKATNLMGLVRKVMKEITTMQHTVASACATTAGVATQFADIKKAMTEQGALTEQHRVQLDALAERMSSVVHEVMEIKQAVCARDNVIDALKEAETRLDRHMQQLDTHVRDTKNKEAMWTSTIMEMKRDQAAMREEIKGLAAKVAAVAMQSEVDKLATLVHAMQAQVEGAAVSSAPPSPSAVPASPSPSAVDQLVSRVEALETKVSGSGAAVPTASMNRSQRAVMEFLFYFGMNSVTGYMCAVPVAKVPMKDEPGIRESVDSLHLVVCIPLLVMAMQRMYPDLVRSDKLNITAPNVRAMFSSLRSVTSAVKTPYLTHRMARLFGVREEKYVSRDRDVHAAWAVMELGAVMQYMREVKSNPEGRVLPKEPERSVMKLKYDAETTQSVWSQESMDNLRKPEKMAWACEVQREVLEALPVKPFFQRIVRDLRHGRPFNAETPGCWDSPFHFSGMRPLFSRRPRAHSVLVAERTEAYYMAAASTVVQTPGPSTWHPSEEEHPSWSRHSMPANAAPVPSSSASAPVAAAPVSRRRRREERGDEDDETEPEAGVEADKRQRV